MKKQFISAFATLFFLFVILACNRQPVSSMDEETEQTLVEQYGEPTVVRLSAPGTLKAQLSVLPADQHRFIRIFGTMNAEDFAYLNTCDSHSDILVLDLLDASIVAGDSAYLKNFGEDAFRITEDNTMGCYQFDGLFQLQRLYLPLTLTKLSDKAFYSKYNLDYIALPPSLREIGDYVFDGCFHLTSVVLPDSLLSIGYHSFPSSVRSLRIPRSVCQLHDGGIGEQEEYYMEWTPDELTPFENVSFEWIKMQHDGPHTITSWVHPTLHVPAAYVDAYKEAFRTPNKVVADETEN